MIFVVLSQVSNLSLPLLMSEIINKGIKYGDIPYIVKVGAIMMCLSAFGVGVNVLNSYFSSKTSAAYGMILRRELFLKVESLSQTDIDAVGTPSLITRCTNDVKVIQDFILTCLRMIISVPIMLVGGVVMAFILNARLATVIFAVIPVIAVIAVIVIKTAIPIFRKRQKLIDKVNSFMREKINGIRVIRAFGRMEAEDEKFDGTNRELSGLTLKFQRFMSVLIPVCIVIIIIALDLLIMIAAKNYDSLDHILDAAKLSTAIGDLQAFVIYMVMIISSMTMVAAMFVIVPRARISANRIIEILDIVPVITEPEKAEKTDESKKGTVEFRNVSFGYADAEEKVLSDISFTAEAGKVTAIIGGTGSGKSTLVNMIPRFYDATEGEILFDGADVRKLSQEDLRSRIGFIPQKACLFSGSIEENLRYGDENATEERMRLALDISQSSEFVDKLPGGIKTFVSQNGTNLSGGQKQRLSIARALTRDAEVYIFDDSFSALDFSTDARLRRAIKENLTATVIIVAQRVGTIIDADRIVVLDRGKICGMGTHKELMKDCALYREIYDSQIEKEEE
ncbi:MAG: ABC transporter ATP-binding protein [Ruminococcaceae bacterium]|nr:ABC transporter ATP-binding protein [Oscillospiraceae bacterium]